MIRQVIIHQEYTCWHLAEIFIDVRRGYVCIEGVGKVWEVHKDSKIPNNREDIEFRSVMFFFFFFFFFFRGGGEWGLGGANSWLET